MMDSLSELIDERVSKPVNACIEDETEAMDVDIVKGPSVKDLQLPLKNTQNIASPATMKSRHILEVVGAYVGDGTDQIVSIVHQSVHEQLRHWGIDMEPRTTRGRSKSRRSNSYKDKTPCILRNDLGCNRLVETKLTHWNVTVKVPILIKQTCDFLRKHVKTEGIFRKSGSSSRVQALMQRFACLDQCKDFSFAACDTVFDVATVLKQYLREMDSPVIPYDTHSLFRKCLEVTTECSREEAVLLCTCLLPEANISILTYLMEFLMEVVECSKENRMTFENLAIVIGPNIMPVDRKKTSDKTKELENERKVIDAHTKIVEMLIRNMTKVGCLPSLLDKKVENDFSARGSEDEVENEGIRRKKRRSGSLTRVLGFLRKVTNKTGDTPVAQTPVDFNDFTHTPVMKSTKRRCLDENIFSLQKKKTILDGIRKNGLTVKDDDKRFSHITDTPNSIVGFITCPSPICLNPSPMKSDWKQTPNAGRFKNLVTPSLLRRKEKNVTDLLKSATGPFSAPSKPFKSRVLGKKSSKKQQQLQPPAPAASQVLTDSNGSQRRAASTEVKRLSSIQSIHKLAQSPRKALGTVGNGGVVRAASTRIPRPEKVNLIRKSNSSCRFMSQSQSPREREGKALDRERPSSSRKPAALKKNVSGLSGEYVTISPSARISDVKNEAFIASKISCLEDTVDMESERKGIGSDANPGIRLTPLIKEINTLTLTAQQEELTLSGLRKKRSVSKFSPSVSSSSVEKAPPVPSRATRRRSSGASSNKARLESPPKESSSKSCTALPKRRSSSLQNQKGEKERVRHHEMETRSKTILAVEEKFSRAMKETKIMRIQSERSAQKNPRAVNIHRRFSIQDKGVSPSQRRINQAARRKSQEMKGAQTGASSVQAPTPINGLGMGMTTPIHDLSRFRLESTTTPSSSISRSPNRCTLKRGRPNTLRSGLARPSPVSSRNTSRVNDEVTSSKDINPPIPASTPATVTVPLQAVTRSGNKSKSKSASPSPAVSGSSSSQPCSRATPMRRMSSVQELVKYMDKPSKKDSSNSNSLKPSSKTRTEPPLPRRTLSRRESSTKFIKPMPKRSQSSASTPRTTPKRDNTTPDAWVPATDFNFDTHRTRFLRNNSKNEDRDSIQALKALNAGKVSENVKLFDSLSRTRKSPGKSLIPRERDKDLIEIAQGQSLQKVVYPELDLEGIMRRANRRRSSGIMKKHYCSFPRFYKAKKKFKDLFRKREYLKYLKLKYLNP